MKRFNRDELLGWLDKCWSLYTTSQPEWGLAQQAYKQIESLIQKKPEVTEEWIERKAREMAHTNFLGATDVYIGKATNFIHSLLKEATNCGA